MAELTMKVSITGTELFEKILDVIKDITEDERLPVEMKNEIETKMNGIVSEIQASK
jgi:hypothetical protein